MTRKYIQDCEFIDVLQKEGFNDLPDEFGKNVESPRAGWMRRDENLDCGKRGFINIYFNFY